MFRPLALAILLFVASFASAADQPAKSGATDSTGLFEQLDADKDGFLAAGEVPDDRKTLFNRLVRIGDKNGDDKLDANEFANALSGDKDQADAASKPDRPEGPDRTGRAGALFEKLDANGDGKIVLDEVPEPGRERFKKFIARADKDGDGAVSRSEFAQAGPPGRPDEPKKPDDAKKPADSKKPDQPKAKRPEGGRDASQLFRRMDRNADGKLTADEVPEERRPMVERMIERGDRDGDKGLSSAEFQKAFERRRPGGPGPSAGSPERDFLRQAGLFAVIDVNGDGQLSGEEISASAEALRKLDADGDGSVSGREIFLAGARNRKKNP